MIRCLAHALRQQALPQAVIDFVRAGVQQVFALEVNLRAAELFRQPLGKEQRVGRPAYVRSNSSRRRWNLRSRLAFS